MTYLGGLIGWHLQRKKNKRRAREIAKYKKSRLTSMRLELDNADTKNRKLLKEISALKTAFAELEANYNSITMESENWKIKYDNIAKELKTIIVDK